MKKFKKITAALLLIVCLFTLCGCDALDKLRSLHATYAEDDRTQINYSGSVYKEIKTSYNDSFYGFYDYIYITENDVPVLLSQMVGTTASINEAKTAICFDYGSGIYVREDIYDMAKSEIDNGLKYTKYLFEAYDENYNIEYQYLDGEQLQTFEKLINAEPIRYPEDGFDTENYMDIYAETESGIFRIYKYELNECTDGKYIVSEYIDGEHYYYYDPDPDVTELLKDMLYESID